MLTVCGVTGSPFAMVRNVPRLASARCEYRVCTRKILPNLVMCNLPRERALIEGPDPSRPGGRRCAPCLC